MVTRHDLATRLAVDQESCIPEKRLKLGLAPEPLTFDHRTVVVLLGEVVEHDDERLWLPLSGGSESSRDQLGLCLAKELDQGVIAQIADDPDHEDAAVLEPPVEVLYRGLCSIAETSVADECISCLFHGCGALIEDINLAVLPEQEVLAEPTVSTSHIEGSEERP